MKHTSYWLELNAGDYTNRRGFADKEFALVAADDTASERCKALWREVGRGFWNERESWGEADWRHHLRRPEVSFWILLEGGNDAGFFELQQEAEGVKLEGFGLLPSHRGRGIGGALLCAAIERGFHLDPQRIWLHTATDDHPNALPNYLKRGFRIYREEALPRPMTSQLEE